MRQRLRPPLAKLTVWCRPHGTELFAGDKLRTGKGARLILRLNEGSDKKDIVCLIEGKIDVTGNNNLTLRLDQPLQFFQSTRNDPPEPVSFLDRKQLEIWARETDIEAGQGVRTNGRWKIVLGGFVGYNAILTTSRALREAGYTHDRTANNTLTISRLVGEADHNALAAKIAAEFRLNDVRVFR